MATPTLIQALTIVAGVLAVASLVLTLLFVHDRRQRRAGILISASIICGIVGSMFGDAAIGIVITGVALVTAIAAGILTISALRIRAD